MAGIKGSDISDDPKEVERIKYIFNLFNGQEIKING